MSGEMCTYCGEAGGVCHWHGCELADESTLCSCAGCADEPPAWLDEDAAAHRPDREPAPPAAPVLPSTLSDADLAFIAFAAYEHAENSGYDAKRGWYVLSGSAERTQWELAACAVRDAVCAPHAPLSCAEAGEVVARARELVSVWDADSTQSPRPGPALVISRDAWRALDSAMDALRPALFEKETKR